MYNQHPCFDTPPTGHVLWRYMPFANFIKIIETSSLWFAIPAQFEDQWEGRYPLSHHDEEVMKDLYVSDPPLSHEDRRDFARGSIEMLEQVYTYTRRRVGICCWTAKENESISFWQRYCGQDKKMGVAIRTRLGRLIESLRETTFPVYIGRIAYLDRDNDIIPSNNLFWSVLWKDNRHVDDEEVRAVIPRQVVSIDERTYALPKTDGDKVRVILPDLIEEVVLSPYSESSLLDEVKKRLSLADIALKCTRSTLNDPPPIGSIRR
ncbi:MAG TPA: hypothetical protein VIT91_03460 [Chthoniobacterales bacterium]